MPHRPAPSPAGSAPRRAGRHRLPAGYALLAVLVLATAGARPALAQTSSATTPAPSASSQNPSGSNRWGFTPTGPDRTVPGPRNDFTYQLAAGASVDDSVTVWNYSDVPANFVLYATDALNTPDGSFDLLRRDQTPVDAGTWVKVSEGSVIVPPRSAMTVPFTVTVPADARPGDHAGGLVASIEAPGTDPTGNAVTVDTRFGLPAYIQVAGTLTPGFTVEDVQSHYTRSPFSVGGGELDISWTVHNTGNVRLSAHQLVKAQAPFGLTLVSEAQDDVPELLPDARVSEHAHLTGVLPTFRVTGLVELDPFSRAGDLDPPPPRATGSATVWAVPWLLVVALGVLVGLLVWRRRAVRRRRAATPAAPPTPAVPAGVGSSSGP